MKIISRTYVDPLYIWFRCKIQDSVNLVAMLFKNVQNLVDTVSNLRGTFDFCRPWPIKAHASRRWCTMGGAGGAGRSSF